MCRIWNGTQTRRYTRRWYIRQIKWCMPWYRPPTHRTQTWLEQACADISPDFTSPQFVLLHLYIRVYYLIIIVAFIMLCGENGFLKLLSLSLVSRKKPRQHLIQAKKRNKDVREASVLVLHWDQLGSRGYAGLWQGVSILSDSMLNFSPSWLREPIHTATEMYTILN